MHIPISSGPWNASLLVIAILCASVTASGRQAVTPNAKLGTADTIRMEKDVEYGTAAGESLKLDLYRPAAQTTALHPGLVFIHGGGWSGGDKGEYTEKAKEMAGLGYVCISINYRLAPKHHYPANIEDVQRAVRWLRNRAAEYHLDPNRIGALGSSAGGHLASILGVRDTLSIGNTEDKVSSRVNCVVDYFGRMDLTLEPIDTTGFKDYRPDYLGKPKAEALDLYRDASPITYVDKKTVPFLLIHGSRDKQVEPRQSERMLAALDKASIESSLLMLNGAGHGFGGAPGQMAWDAAKAFLNRHLMH